LFVCGLGEWVTGTGFRVAAVLDSAICESSEGERCPILEVITSLPVQMLWIGSLSPVVAETGSVSKVSGVLVSRMKVGSCELKSHLDFKENLPDCDGRDFRKSSQLSPQM
jgi:hypothetical protein